MLWAYSPDNAGSREAKADNGRKGKFGQKNRKSFLAASNTDILKDIRSMDIITLKREVIILIALAVSIEVCVQ